MLNDLCVCVYLCVFVYSDVHTRACTLFIYLSVNLSIIKVITVFVIINIIDEIFILVFSL